MQLGLVVAGGGNFNGDHYDDIVVLDPDSLGEDRIHVVYGRQSPFGSTANVDQLDGNTGFTLTGSFSSAVVIKFIGDIDNDGFDDLAIGDRLASPNGLQLAGATYSVFGQDASLPATLDVSELNGDNGLIRPELSRHLSGSQKTAPQLPLAQHGYCTSEASLDCRPALCN